jgi:hypothetical protein
VGQELHSKVFCSSQRREAFSNSMCDGIGVKQEACRWLLHEAQTVSALCSPQPSTGQTHFPHCLQFLAAFPKWVLLID